jgi:hypothetical protein
MPDIKSKVEENTKDIGEIKQTLTRLETNHIFHIEKDMERQTKQIEKIDNRLWWVLGILVVSTVIGMISDGL